MMRHNLEANAFVFRCSILYDFAVLIFGPLYFMCLGLSREVDFWVVLG